MLAVLAVSFIIMLAVRMPVCCSNYWTCVGFQFKNMRGEGLYITNLDLRSKSYIFQSVLFYDFCRNAFPFVWPVTNVAQVFNAHLAGKKTGGSKAPDTIKKCHALLHTWLGLVGIG